MMEWGVRKMKVQSNRFEVFVLFVLAYEWLVSASDKILGGQFVSGLHSTLTGAVTNIPYTFYRYILQHWVIPHAAMFAWSTMIGESLIGLCFVAVAVTYIRGRITPVVRTIGVASLLLAAFMNMNFFFFQAGHFFVTLSDSFDEGIPVDFVMAIIEIGLVISLIRTQWAPSCQVDIETINDHDTSRHSHQVHGMNF